MIQRQSSIVTGAAEDFVKLYKSAMKADRKLVSEYAKKISEMETECDGLRRTVTNNLSVGELPSSIREDLMHLTRRIDDIIDWVMAATRSISVVDLKVLPKEIRDSGLRMTEITKDCAWTFRKCVNQLYVNPKEAVKLIADVEKHEHRVDELWGEVRNRFLKVTCEELPLGTAIMMYELFKSIESVADRCEDAADLVGVIAVRHSE